MIHLVVLLVLASSTPEQVREEARSVVKITNKIAYGRAGGKVRGYTGGSGTGVAIAVSGDRSVVLTAAHVVRPVIPPAPYRVLAAQLVVELVDGTVCPAARVYGDAATDIAFLFVGCAVPGVAQLSSSLPAVGEWMTAIGCPQGYRPTGGFVATDGRYLGVDPESDQLVTSVPISEGSSGSPVFFEGKVVGIVSRVMIRFQNVSFLVPIHQVQAALAWIEREGERSQ